MKRALICVLCLVILFGLAGCSKSGETIYFFNWMEYIDPDVLDIFKDETGITVIVDPFESNEIMYTKVAKSGGYDILCPSEYMAERMINEGLLAKIDFGNIPNFRDIDDNLKGMGFDPGNEYFVPYMWGTVGILYDKERVIDPITSWDDLWDLRYSGEIFMYNSVRDTMSVALKRLGYSLNTKNEAEINEAVSILIEQYPLVQAYLSEPIKDKMIGGEGILAVMYSGDAMYCMMNNEGLDYVVPEEGSNIWIDGLVIPKTAKNKAGAERFIDFLCRPEIAAMNSEYIGYATANKAALQLIDEELREHPVFWPSDAIMERCEYHADLGDFTAKYSDAFDRVLISGK